MSRPRYIRPREPGDYLDIISRAVFSAGLSWAFIDAKWDAFEEAFCRFDLAKVAAFDEFTIRQLAENPQLLRSERKIAATVENAKALLAIEREHGSVRAWLDSFKLYADAAKDVSKRFKFLSKTFGAYYFLYIAGAKIPDFPTFEEWSKQTGEEHPRMRELVAANEQRDVQPSGRRRSSRKV
ncbi:MAG: DNA-3-methyladenine glycosylase I [Vulcanimicrobiaceae bacterium]